MKFIAATLLTLSTGMVDANTYMMCTPNQKPKTDPAVCKEHTPAILEVIDICTGGKSSSAKVVDLTTDGGARRHLRGDEGQESARRLSGDQCLELDHSDPIGLLMACCLVGDYSYCGDIEYNRRLAADVSAEAATEASLPSLNNACTASFKALAAQTRDHDCFGTPETATCIGFYAAS